MMSPRNRELYLKRKGISTDLRKISLFNIYSVIEEDEKKKESKADTKALTERQTIDKKVDINLVTESAVDDDQCSTASHTLKIKCPQPQVSRKLKGICVPSTSKSSMKSNVPSMKSNVMSNTFASTPGSTPGRVTMNLSMQDNNSSIRLSRLQG